MTSPNLRLRASKIKHRALTTSNLTQALADLAQANRGLPGEHFSSMVLALVRLHRLNQLPAYEW
jgi:hypothetical protein